MLVAPPIPLTGDKQNCLQTLLDVPWKTKSPLVETCWDFNSESQVKSRFKGRGRGGHEYQETGSLRAISLKDSHHYYYLGTLLAAGIPILWFCPYAGPSLPLSAHSNCSSEHPLLSLAVLCSPRVWSLLLATLVAGCIGLLLSFPSSAVNWAISNAHIIAHDQALGQVRLADPVASEYGICQTHTR